MRILITFLASSDIFGSQKKPYLPKLPERTKSFSVARNLPCGAKKATAFLGIPQYQEMKSSMLGNQIADLFK